MVTQFTERAAKEGPMRQTNLIVDQGDEIQSFLDRRFSDTCCSWCKDPDRQLYGKRLPLCASCRRIQRSISKYEKLAEMHRPKSERSIDKYGEELAVARQMKALAERDGAAFGNINSRSMGALDLEHILVKVSKIAVRREIFDNWATILDHSFSESQQRLLFYMVSQVVRAHNCKHRYYKAGNSLPDDWDNPLRKTDSQRSRSVRP